MEPRRLANYYRVMFIRTGSLVVVLLAIGITRSLAAITIDIDYTLDTAGPFFDTQQKKDAVESAADFLSHMLTDRLEAIVPSGDNHWVADFTSPGTGVRTRLHDLTIPADTLLVYAGGHDLDGRLLAQGGPGERTATGDSAWVNNTTLQRGQPRGIGPERHGFRPLGRHNRFRHRRPKRISTQLAHGPGLRSVTRTG